MISLQGLICKELKQQNALSEKYQDMALEQVGNTLTIVPVQAGATVTINGKQTTSEVIHMGESATWRVDYQNCYKTGTLTPTQNTTLNIDVFPFDTIPKMTWSNAPEGLVEQSSIYQNNEGGSGGWRSFDQNGGISQGREDSSLWISYTYARMQYAGTYYVTYTSHPGWRYNAPRKMIVWVYGTDNQWHSIKTWDNLPQQVVKYEESGIQIPVNFTKVKFDGTVWNSSSECGWAAAQLRRTA